MLKRCVLMLMLVDFVPGFSYVSAQGSGQAPAAAPAEHRKTSEPYTGDLSIFDSPGRDERLQSESRHGHSGHHRRQDA